MKQYLSKIIFMVLSILFFYGCSQEPYDWTPIEDAISVSDCEVSYPQLNSIKISFISKKENSRNIKVQEAFIKYGKNNLGSCNYDKKVSIDNFNLNGQNSVEINDLESNSSYSFRICLKIEGFDEIIVYELKKYIPSKEDFIPSLGFLDLTADEVYSSIYAKCSVTQQVNTNLFPIIEAGFFYGLTSDVTYETGTIIQGTINGNELSAEISGLSYLQKYYVGAFIKTEEGVKTTSVKQISVEGPGLDIVIDELIPKEKGFGIKFLISKYNPEMVINNITLEISAVSGRISPEWNITDLYTPVIQENSDGTVAYTYDLLDENLTNLKMKSNEDFNVNFIINVIIDGKSLYKTICYGKGTWYFTTL